MNTRDITIREIKCTEEDAERIYKNFVWGYEDDILFIERIGYVCEIIFDDYGDDTPKIYQYKDFRDMLNKGFLLTLVADEFETNKVYYNGIGIDYLDDYYKVFTSTYVNQNLGWGKLYTITDEYGDPKVDKNTLENCATYIIEELIIRMNDNIDYDGCQLEKRDYNKIESMACSIMSLSNDLDEERLAEECKLLCWNLKEYEYCKQ